jgi:hypothetical protein
MKKKHSRITKEQLRKIAAGARRSVDIEMGIGLNAHHTVSVDRRKENNKNLCRDKKNSD